MNNTKNNNVFVHPTAVIYPNVILHDNVSVGANCVIGEPTADFYNDKEHHEFKPVEIGLNSIIRANTIIYEGVSTGKNFQTGNSAVIREDTVIGNNCSVGTFCDIQGKTTIGDFCRLHSNVHIGQKTVIGNYVWLFPYVITTNDKYPPMDVLEGCTINDYAIVATRAVLLPGVTIGENAMVAADALVTKDVAPHTVVMGQPAKFKCQVEDIRDNEGKRVYPWRDYLQEYRGYPWQKVKKL